ncbi:hypothetical protein Tsubulata_035024 [Turnera subulata]|uniref:DUF3456 domain-containing protein n=1 Tax=Turnera subulata TaxID=218843 RepID=A0A9Q0F5S5_9ROSI|nr:hypothetical protein Tsubulata_035024 [Turnera subulata]
MALSKIPSSWILAVLALAAVVVTVKAIDHRCAACNAVAEEIELGLSNVSNSTHIHLPYSRFLHFARSMIVSWISHFAAIK